jgi:hypothetical protein
MWVHHVWPPHCTWARSHERQKRAVATTSPHCAWAEMAAGVLAEAIIPATISGFQQRLGYHASDLSATYKCSLFVSHLSVPSVPFFIPPVPFLALIKS